MLSVQQASGQGALKPSEVDMDLKTVGGLFLKVDAEKRFPGSIISWVPINQLAVPLTPPDSFRLSQIVINPSVSVIQVYF